MAFYNVTDVNLGCQGVVGQFAVAALYERRKCRGINTGGHRPPLQKVNLTHHSEKGRRDEKIMDDESEFKIPVSTQTTAGIQHSQFTIHNSYQPPSFFRAVSLTRFPSAFLPASFAIAAFMTLPRSLGPAAPVSAMAAATAASISASGSAAGR